MAEDRITTPGSVKIKHMLPNGARDKYDLYRTLDKPGITDLITLILKHGGEKGFDSINDLTKLFFNTATEIGASTPLSDYDNDSSERHAILGEFEHNVANILKSNVSKQEKYVLLDNLAGKVRGHLNNQNLEYLVSRGSIAAKMAKTGARGNPSQFAIGTASPLMASDVKGMPIPIAIKKSFAEGLSPAEFIAMSYGGRASTVASQLSTQLPGALFKKLTPNVFHEVITITDCKTSNGVMVPINDKKTLIGRYQAGTNHMIDETYYRDLTGKQVKIRSPLTCEAHEGICQKCYGIAANGKLPTIGENVGVIAAQSVSEVLTQAMLSTKHQGGVAGRRRTAYDEANNILNNPAKNFQDEAAIATLNGKITAIKTTPLKDYEIYVNNIEHFASKFSAPMVSVGDNVKIGQQISEGTINPRKLVGLKGLGAGRKYLSSQLREIYGAGLDPRHFDIIAKNLIRYAVINHPGDTGFLPGQKVDISEIEKHIKNDKKEVPLSQAEGKTLSRKILEMTPGTILTSNHIDELAASGVDRVHITTSGLHITPLVPGLQTVKLLDKNWVSKLSAAKLESTLRDAAAFGSESDIHSADPIPSYMMGTEFGEGERGKY